jgi:transcriptional regulator with XRE-family HTH domain
MPVKPWNGIEDTEAAAKIVGPRLRQLREGRGLTIRDVAERLGISKNTVLRIEQGHPIAEPLLHRICDNLQTILPNLLIPPELVEDQRVKVSRAGEMPWRIAFRRQRAPRIYKDFDPVPDPEERHRLGNLGFVSGFFETQGSALTGGKLEAAVVELFGDQERPGFRHSGEEFVYCLSGQLRLTVGREVHVLNPGDSATFWSRHRHRYESCLPSPSSEVTRMIMVWYEAPEDEKARAHDDECEAYPETWDEPSLPVPS